MGERYNIYCDESCHLENDRASVMVLGAVSCKASRSNEISNRVRDIKLKHGLLSREDLKKPKRNQFEIKWTKISRAKLDFYLDLVDYFFDEHDLHFRGVLIDKGLLDHRTWRQSHDDWYYKMMFTLLEPVIDPRQRYCVYLDIKDTQSERKRAKLEEVLRASKYDYANTIIDRVQQIRSHESEILQLADLLLGAVAYHNRCQQGDLPGAGASANPAKREVIRRIQHRSGKSLERSTWLRESKFNLLRWQPREARP